MAEREAPGLDYSIPASSYAALHLTSFGEALSHLRPVCFHAGARKALKSRNRFARVRPSGLPVLAVGVVAQIIATNVNGSFGDVLVLGAYAALIGLWHVWLLAVAWVR